jgi:hypothetical protein
MERYKWHNEDIKEGVISTTWRSVEEGIGSSEARNNEGHVF